MYIIIIITIIIVIIIIIIIIITKVARRTIQGNKQLADQTQSIDFITRKFDEYKEGRIKKEKIIKDFNY